MTAFQPEIHLAEVNKWLAAREIKPFVHGDLPSLGIIKEGVACGFLVRTDSSVCFLDAFVTNPLASSEDRSDAVSRISRWLIGMASAYGFDRILVLTKEETILRRAQSLGFTISETEVVLGLDL